MCFGVRKPLKSMRGNDQKPNPLERFRCDSWPEYPILADRRPYFEERWMAGRYFPNPYHPPADRVRVKSAWGHRTLHVRNVPVPSNLAHYPQYRSGMMRILE